MADFADGPRCMFRLRDGRSLAYAEYGAPSGRPVLALHGTPGSNLMFAIAAEAADRLGLRLIAPDRWGYGRTDPHPQPSLAAWARDAADLCDGIGVGRFSLIGLSGGSPYAAATAANLDARIIAMALAVPLGPLQVEGASGELGLLHRLMYFGVGQRPKLTRPIFSLFHRLVKRSPRRAVSLVAIGQSRSDRKLLRTPAVQDFLSETFRDGLEPGFEGPAIDLELFSSPWRLPLHEISATTRIWIGGEDRLVPDEAARRLAAEIPGAELTELTGQGHFWIAQDYGQVLEWLAAAHQP